MKNRFEDIQASVKEIIALPVHLRKKRAEEFLAEYEEVILKKPFRYGTREAYEALVKLYTHIAKQMEDAEPLEAISWYERSFVVLNKSRELRATFADIYVQMAYCYLSIGRFDRSIQHLEMYQFHNPEDREICESIKASIRHTEQLYNEAHDVLIETPHDFHFSLACIYARCGYTEKSLYHIEEALKRNLKDPLRILTHPDLADVLRTKEFENLCLKLYKNEIQHSKSVLNDKV